jgi:hypothetical protein
MESWRQPDDAQSLAGGILGGRYRLFLKLHFSSSPSVKYSVNLFSMPTANRSKKILNLGYDFRE